MDIGRQSLENKLLPSRHLNGHVWRPPHNESPHDLHRTHFEALCFEPSLQIKELNIAPKTSELLPCPQSSSTVCNTSLASLLEALDFPSKAGVISMPQLRP